MLGRTILLTLGAALALATPAVADETLGLDEPASVDGVVTSWRLQTSVPQAGVTLRSTQALMGSTATTATGDPVSGTTQTVPARVPIAAGGRLTLDGTTGTPTVAATVEPDRDGDLYGDTTQDACPDDATTRLAPCRGTRTVGGPLTLQPDPRGFSASGNPVQAVQAAAAGTVAAVSADGILTRWRLRARPGADTVLQLLRPGAGGALTVVAESAPIHVTTTDAVMVAARLPVRAGDRLGARSVGGDLGALAYVAGDTLAYNSPPATTWTPDSSTAVARRLLVQADVEPDGDGDGRGDVSQDSADVRLTGFATPSASVIGPWEQTFTVANRGPDPARDVVLTFAPGSYPGAAAPAPGVTCTTALDTAARCTVAQLAPGASFVIRPTRLEPAIYPSLPGPRTSTATVYATTGDPDPTNNGPLTLTTLLTALPPGVTPPPPPVSRPCANVIRGTRDDDVLRGTAFPDRLVGGDGDDLLKGNGADDCLEGGAGADVLDGGDGDDRLDGASGNDRLIGGRGNDKLTAGKGNDRLTGGAGNDTISPGAGHDTVDAGAGNDTINAVDGVRETIDCGPGKDTVRADRRDRLKHCEKITRKKR
jgi:hypothetical protein